MSGVGINTGLKALLSAQAALDTIGNNIANANTPGYSRQHVALSESMSIRVRGLRIGTGVDALSVQRSADQLVLERLLAQHNVGGRLTTLLGGMSEVEGLLGEPGGFGLSSKLGGLFDGFSALSASPADGILRGDAVQSAQDLAGTFNQLASNLATVQDGVPALLELHVGEVNAIAQQIDYLNDEIQETDASGAGANELRDQRDMLLDKLATLVDTQVSNQQSGRVQVTVAGGVLVGLGGVHELQISGGNGTELSLKTEGGPVLNDVKGGVIGGLLQFADGFVSTVEEDLDALAKALVFEVNKVHSTGVPATGSFHSLTSEYALADQNGDGDVTNDLLAKAGLPFEIQSGELYVTVTDEATGEQQKHALSIDPMETTVQGFLDQLSAVAHVSAHLTGQGKLHISSDTGYAFDFSPGLDTNPDEIGTFGGGKASLGTAAAEPFSLTSGDTFDLFHAASGTAVSIAFNSADFGDISAATAEELAAVINADPGAQAAGIEANAVDGHLFLQSQGEGTSESFDVVGGTALGALGWSGHAGTTITGHDYGVQVEIDGDYTGADNEVYSFVPTGDGTIGTTAGLSVEVYDQAGNQVTVLAVGEGYEPGTELEIANGVTVSFGLGELSQTHGDQFTLDVLADSDTSDALAALGLNALFVGTDAATIAVQEDIAGDPNLLATGWSGAEGDNRALLDLLALQDESLDSLSGRSLGGFYGEVVAGVGFEVSAVQTGVEANEALVASLEARRDQVSGVNVDEELVDMMRFEQAFGAAVQFLTIVNQLEDELMGIL